MGRRIAKTIEGQTTYFLYADEGLIAELNEQGKLTKAYGWLADTSYSTSPLWQAEPKAGETTISDLKQAQFHTLTTDHLGTVQMATNEAGQVTWKAQSEAFGKNTPDEQNQITMNLRFPGQYFDEETGTHYNYFRDYNPSIGRYIQRDPIGLKGGINTYGYVRNNSMKFIDPRGLITSCELEVLIDLINNYIAPKFNYPRIGNENIVIDVKSRTQGYTNIFRLYLVIGANSKDPYWQYAGKVTDGGREKVKDLLNTAIHEYVHLNEGLFEFIKDSFTEKNSGGIVGKANSMANNIMNKIGDQLIDEFMDKVELCRQRKMKNGQQDIDANLEKILSIPCPTPEDLKYHD